MEVKISDINKTPRDPNAKQTAEVKTHKDILPDRVSRDLCAMREHFETMLPIMGDTREYLKTLVDANLKMADKMQVMMDHNNEILDQATKNIDRMVTAIDKLVAALDEAKGK